MTKDHPYSAGAATGHRHDYLPAAGRDALLPGYDLFTRMLGMPRVYDLLIDQADVGPGQSILEVGCGTGNVITRLRRRCGDITATGCDPDPRALARARRKARGFTGITFDQGYAQQLPYDDETFDRVLSSMMWHHLDDDVKDAAAEQIFRVLRPGGSLHLVDIGDPMPGDRGLLARHVSRNRHTAGSLGDAIPRRLRSVGFDCDKVATHRLRFIGRVTFFRAVRPG